MNSKKSTLVWNTYDSFMRYHRLNEVDLSDSHFNNASGVYVIWYMQWNRRKIVYIGQSKNGLIRDKLSAHRSDTRIQLYAPQNLYVTWAKAATGVFNIDQIDGIERYIHDILKPLICDCIPETEPIHVNLPWR